MTVAAFKKPDQTTAMLGVGLYTLPEAARYSDVPSAQINRWLFGYHTRDRAYEPVWRSEHADLDQKALGFHDLLEVRFVHAFRQHGVSLQAIRAASNYASDQFDLPYPFTCRQFETDGRSIFASVLENTGDETLLDLVKRQYVFDRIIRPSLYAGIEYDVEGTAQRWFPMPRSKAVVLDPQRNFGKPILSDIGLDTATIASAFAAEDGDGHLVARLYDIPLKAVEAAVKFEKG